MSELLTERYLPDYLRPDLAYLRTTNIAATTGEVVLGIIVPGDSWMRPLSFWHQLTTSAAGGVRVPSLQYADQNGNVYVEVSQTNGQNPSVTVSYGWVTGLTGVLGGTTIHQESPLPDLVLPSGWLFRVFVSAGQASDTFGPFRLLWEAIPTGPALVTPEPAAPAVPLLLT